MVLNVSIKAFWYTNIIIYSYDNDIFMMYKVTNLFCDKMFVKTFFFKYIPRPTKENDPTYFS